MKNDKIYPVGYSDHVISLFSKRTPETNAAFLLPHLKKGQSLLDCGCGPGSITLGFAQLLFPGQVVGVDIQPIQLEQAKKMAAVKNIGNVSFYQYDVTALPFADHSFDVVYANALLCHV